MGFLDRVTNKRAMLAQGLAATGAARALEALGGRRAAVFTYHRVAEPGEGNPYYDNVVSATPEGFRAQMAMVRDRFRVVGPEDLIDDHDDERPRAVVTFDDGYRDNFDAALPILDELGVPATFFIPTDHLERPRLPWWDHLAYIVKSSKLDRFEVERAPGDPRPIVVERADGDRSAAVMTLIRPVLTGEVADRDAFLQRLEAAARVDVDSPALGRELFMTWEHLRKLVDAGHTIGSHAHGHVALGSLDDRSARRELALSRTILEAAVKRPVRTVAYPYGWPGAVSDRTFRLASDVGYRIGFTSFEGIVRPGFDPLAVPRLNVGCGDTTAMLRSRAALWGAFGRSWL
ncbi:polysaccharide deacetylase family protein [Paludisphaera rhizosphaerae]|uniref:polysaccharide deacetylase family protein n=1 Tax=Paludisphaera rhizosphaerae TaxID=2711216 RepID=UPI0013EDA26F|nr:polysaccharide deacetylase family protein [Paludisphaera rhizosphaerae]